MGIITDIDGNVFVNISNTDELWIEKQYSPITHCLAVIKINNDYLFGWNKWRSRYEIFGGTIEKNETAREYLSNISIEEIAKQMKDQDEIGKVELLSNIIDKESIAEIDLKLTEYYL